MGSVENICQENLNHSISLNCNFGGILDEGKIAWPTTTRSKYMIDSKATPNLIFCVMVLEVNASELKLRENVTGPMKNSPIVTHVDFSVIGPIE
jgi:hypothetical protein